MMRGWWSVAAWWVAAWCPAASVTGQEPGKSRRPVVVTEAARKLHREALVFDGHNDLPWKLREKADGFFRRYDLLKVQKDLHTDIPRLRQGNVGAQYWSAYVPSETAHEKSAVRMTLEQIDVIHRLWKKYPQVFEQAETAADIERIRKAGKIASLIGVEGGHSIDGSLGVLRVYYDLGVRYMTLTHSESLEWADSATDKARCGGLSRFGERVVAEMNRLGMLVDISHVSPECMRKVLQVSRAPVLASHSSARAVADHPRNVPDDVLRLVAKNRGVVMVNFFSGFVVPEGARAMKDLLQTYRDLKKKYPRQEEFDEAWSAWKRLHPFPRGTVHDVVDHIDHIVKVAGIDHVGIGSDYDGVSTLPTQLDSVADYPVITQALLDRGYSREDILKVLGGNALRVLREAEQAAAEIRSGKSAEPDR